MSGRVDEATGLVDKHASGGLAFRTFYGRSGLLQISEAWHQVLTRIDRPDFFHQLEWYDALLEAWPETAATTFFKVAYRADDPVAVCPLHLRRMGMHGLTMRMLSPPDPNDVAYPNFVCNDQDRVEVFGSLLQELRSDRNIAWDILTLPRIFSDDDTAAALAANDGVFTHPRGVCYYYQADEGSGAISVRMSSGLRKHLRWCRRQMNALGRVEILSSRDPAKLPQLFDEFLTLEASGWKGAAGEGTALKLDPSLVQFYAGLITRFGAGGNCEINLLRLNGRNLAGQFCLLSGGTWYHLKIAYDEEYDKYSPGSVLLEEILGRLCTDEKVQIASFLTGAAWAERWHALEVGVFRVLARNRTMRGRLMLGEARLRRIAREHVLPAVARFMRRVRSGPQRPGAS